MAVQSEQQRNIKEYKQVKISIASDVALAFKETCSAKNVSMAYKLSEFMAGYSNTTISKKTSPDYSTKRKRRAAIKNIIKQLEQIKTFEERYMDRIPENLCGSVVFDNAEQSVLWLEEVIEILSSI